MDERELAIKARGVVKGYGTQLVLKGLNMNVPYGSIYGLLGSSGCGKTTLLRCILGQFNLSMGQIDVLGMPPGSASHQVPGRDVGYMPQEMALYGDFTMSETLFYFGILHGMKLNDIRIRREFLRDFLELPAQNKLIRTLSGGQKRRFSFAVAMLQEPPLMILDEPTVGVDPILRAKIWEHLVDLVSTARTTVVITTHYIEEARQAHRVGMMREGRLLAEDAPASLIACYQMNSLEDVFLQLCRKQDYEESVVLESKTLHESSSTEKYNPSNSDEATPLLESHLIDNVNTIARQREMNTFSGRAKQKAISFVTSCKCTRNPFSALPRLINIVALCWKNLMHIYRNPGLLMFQFVLPAFQILLFILAIGQNFEGIKLAYSNDDAGYGNVTNLSSLCNADNRLADYSDFGGFYMSKLWGDSTFYMMEFDQVEDAVEQVRLGKAWAAIYIGSNFTTDLINRICNISNCPYSHSPVTYKTINGSSIHIYSDITNLQIAAVVTNHTLMAYEEFSTQMARSCRNILSIDANMFASPLMHEAPVYGRTDLSFTDYMAPGMITSITFGISIGLCAMALITERNEGLIDRTWVAGVNIAEIIIAQVITQFFILLIQIILLISVAIFGFRVYTANLTHIWLIGALAMLQGLTGKFGPMVLLSGMAFGLFLSAVCTTENAAIQSTIAVFYPSLLLSGVLWPLEGMPAWLRYISYSLPSTLPAEAMRSIMGRGWGLEHEAVWHGFLLTIGWFLVFLLMSGLAFSLRK